MCDIRPQVRYAGAAQRLQYNPWTNAFGHGSGHQPPAAPFAGHISSSAASLRSTSQAALPTFGGAAYRASAWPPLGADSGKENSCMEGKEHAFKVPAAGNWAGYEDTERLIQQIQGRYEEAQQILQRHS